MWSQSGDVRPSVYITNVGHRYLCLTGKYGAATGSCTRTNWLEASRAAVKHYCRKLEANRGIEPAQHAFCKRCQSPAWSSALNGQVDGIRTHTVRFTV